MEIKAILRQYAFSLVIIICVGLFLTGIICVREKTQYNMDMTAYETVEIDNMNKILTEITKIFLTQTIYGDNIG